MSAYKPFLLIAAAAAFAACAARDEPDTTTTTTVTTAQGTVDLAADVRVDDIDLGRGIGVDKKVIDLTDTFAPTDTIAVSVRTTGMGTGAKLTARWLFQDTVTVHEQTETFSPTGETWTPFTLSRATPWEEGKYKLVVLLNGKEIDTEEFTVKM